MLCAQESGRLLSCRCTNLNRVKLSHTLTLLLIFDFYFIFCHFPSPSYSFCKGSNIRQNVHASETKTKCKCEGVRVRVPTARFLKRLRVNVMRLNKSLPSTVQWTSFSFFFFFFFSPPFPFFWLSNQHTQAEDDDPIDPDDVSTLMCPVRIAPPIY